MTPSEIALDGGDYQPKLLRPDDWCFFFVVVDLRKPEISTSNGHCTVFAKTMELHPISTD